jgi:hypothetical protein
MIAAPKEQPTTAMLAREWSKVLRGGAEMGLQPSIEPAAAFKLADLLDKLAALREVK